MSSPRSSPTAASIAAMSQPTGQPSPTERRPTGESAVDEDQRPGGRDGSGPAGSRWEQLLDEPGAAWTSAAAMRLSGCGAAQANFRPAGRPRMRVKPGSPASPRPPSARPTPPRPPTPAPVRGSRSPDRAISSPMALETSVRRRGTRQTLSRRMLSGSRGATGCADHPGSSRQARAGARQHGRAEVGPELLDRLPSSRQ
jgi:hypothetical protein